MCELLFRLSHCLDCSFYFIFSLLFDPEQYRNVFWQETGPQED